MKHLIAFTITFLLTTPAFAFEVEYIGASTTPMENPHDIKLSPDGDVLFVSDVGNNRVLALNPDTLEPLGSFGADHQSGTHDIDFDLRGFMYVADTHNNRVTVYQMTGVTGKLVQEISDRIRGPEGVLVHPNGTLYVAGAWSGNVVAYDQGVIIGELTGLSSPHDLELAPSCHIPAGSMAVF